MTVSYLGAANFAASHRNITVTITVTKKKATVTAPNVSVVYGQTVVLPITVKGSAGTPTGHVQVLYGSKSLGTGDAARRQDDAGDPGEVTRSRRPRAVAEVQR